MLKAFQRLQRAHYSPFGEPSPRGCWSHLPL